jgi:hypothetical protein
MKGSKGEKTSAAIRKLVTKTTTAHKSLADATTKAVAGALGDDYNNVVVIAVHKSQPLEPIVFFRGHVYDAARLAAYATRKFREMMDQDLRIDRQR